MSASPTCATSPRSARGRTGTSAVHRSRMPPESARPRGVIAYEPADMTITVGAGTSFDELDRVLAEHGQQCALDPRAGRATVGGILACGLSGPRRLRHGPVRDHVLEVRFETGDGRLVKGGGPTVKNVTGYDLPRLFVGSLGTIGVLQQATLRCRPRPARCTVVHGRRDPSRAFRPSARLWDGEREAVLLEGIDVDVEAETPRPRRTRRGACASGRSASRPDLGGARGGARVRRRARIRRALVRGARRGHDPRRDR